MEATKMMREMMIAASLLAVTACGAVEPLDTAQDPEDGMGADIGGADAGVGSGSGSGSGSATGCTKASECDAGMSCDISSAQCVKMSLTLDDTGFYNDGMRFWTNTTSPAFSGTYEGPHGALVSAKMGAVDVVVTMTATGWTTSPPTNAAFSVETTLVVTLTDPSGGATTIEQVVTRDTVPPVVTILPTNVLDERLDSIEFTANGPVHTHTGTGVELGATGCPTVYKYPYLMDVQAPTYGSETNANPLAWKLSIADAKVVSASFGLRGVNNTVFKNWTPVPVGPQITIPLLARGPTGTPNRVPALDSQSGRYYIDVSVIDWAGIETVVTGCFDYQPLAAPLEIGQVGAATGPNALSGWSLPANSPISRLLGSGTGARVLEQRIVQHTAEPMFLSIPQTSLLRGSYVRSSISGYVTTAIGAEMRCYDMYANSCSQPGPAVAPVVTTTGTLSNYSSFIYVVDDTGTVVARADGTYFQMPGRQPGQAPRVYTMIVDLGQVSNLRPDPNVFSYDELTLGGKTYTGSAPDPGFTLIVCGGQTTVINAVPHCVNPVRYERITALDRGQLTLDYSGAMVTGVAAELMRLPPHVPQTAFSVVLGWDSGNDDLPGPN